MDRFAQCLTRVLKFEGGKCDDPADRGGRTAFGITQQSYDAYRVNRGFPIVDVWGIKESEVRDIYFSSYWNPCKCGQLPEGLDFAVFDASVQHGTRRAAKWLQEALGMQVGDRDGVLGAQTLRWVHDMIVAKETSSVVKRFQQIRARFYDDIIARDESQKRFEKGWANRLYAVDTAITEDIA